MHRLSVASFMWLWDRDLNNVTRTPLGRVYTMHVGGPGQPPLSSLLATQGNNYPIQARRFSVVSLHFSASHCTFVFVVFRTVFRIGSV
jgi:hypothetical protein